MFQISKKISERENSEFFTSTGLNKDLTCSVDEGALFKLSQKCLTFGLETNDAICRFIEVLAVDGVKNQ